MEKCKHPTHIFKENLIIRASPQQRQKFPIINMNRLIIRSTQLALKNHKDSFNFILDLQIGIFFLQLNFAYLDFKLVGLHFNHCLIVEVLCQAFLLHPEEVHKVVWVEVRCYGFQLVESFDEELELSFLVLKALIILERIKNTLSMQYPHLKQNNLPRTQFQIILPFIHSKIRK